MGLKYEHRRYGSIFNFNLSLCHGDGIIALSWRKLIFLIDWVHAWSHTRNSISRKKNRITLSINVLLDVDKWSFTNCTLNILWELAGLQIYPPICNLNLLLHRIFPNLPTKSAVIEVFVALKFCSDFWRLVANRI